MKKALEAGFMLWDRKSAIYPSGRQEPPVGDALPHPPSGKIFVSRSRNGLPLNIRNTGIEAWSHLDTNFCTPESKRFAAGKRSQALAAVCLNTVVTGEMLLRQEPFQIVDCSPTTLALTRRWAHNNCYNGSAGRFLTIPCVVLILLPATLPSVPALENVSGEAAFPQ
ncbi:hypothetical protein AVEN_112591-1 [Araneus ventricosus]|uniref:Uncharacterized protein n=1 Tax=Araneus ventricosus TaxID=182803 RepID=A0A4Y2L326_ARAVE|nr:hypothetical protein AVEN_112591-1 [Araneus ventricosus]